MARLLVALLLVVVCMVGGASAHEEIFIATMTNAGEPGGVTPTASGGGPRPASFGTATFVLNDAHTALTMTAVINNIDVNGLQTPNDTNDNLTAAHIHAGASIVPTAGVVWGFFGSPFNDNNPNDAVVTPFAAPLVGGTFTGKWDAPEGQGTTLAAQLANIMQQRSYINFHTIQFGGGEIRGTLIPEPSTVLLAGLGLVGLGCVALRRRYKKAA